MTPTIPLTLGKSELADLLCVSTKTLSRLYMTDTVITELGFNSRDEYKRTRVFDVTQTSVLIQKFNLYEKFNTGLRRGVRV